MNDDWKRPVYDWRLLWRAVRCGLPVSLLLWALIAVVVYALAWFVGSLFSLLAGLLV